MAIEYLSSSYAGVPKMVNLLMQWLHIAGCKQKEIQGMVEDHYTSVILKHFDPKKADHVLIEGGEVRPARVKWVGLTCDVLLDAHLARGNDTVSQVETVALPAF